MSRRPNSLVSATDLTHRVVRGVVGATLAIGAAGVLALPGSTAVWPSASSRHATVSSPQVVSKATSSKAPLADASASPGILAPPDAIVGEGDGVVNFAVKLSEQGVNPVTVHFAATNGTAGAGFSCNGDFEPKSETLTFGPGETEKLVPITIKDCADVEDFDTFTLDLTNPTGGGQIWRARTRIGIVDNDTVAGTPGLFVRDVTVDEKDDRAFVSVLLGGTDGQASSSTVTVNYSTASGTAISGSDFAATSDSLTFSPGDTAETIAIPITDDATAEGVESFTLNLSSPDHASIGDGSGVITIGHSDGPDSSQPLVSAPADQIVGEGDGYVDLAVSLSQPSANVVTAHFDDANATAGAGFSCNGGFIPVEGDLNFAPGETTKVVRIELLDCLTTQGFSTFSFRVPELGATNAAVSRASTLIGIVDNETVVATPRLFARDAVVDEKEGFAYVPVLLGGPHGQASNSTVTVKYASAGGTATSGSDFDEVTGTLSFAPGETAKTVVVPITDDATVEAAEDFKLTLSDAPLATISDASARVVIGASDGAPSAQPDIRTPADVSVGEGDGYIDFAVTLSAPSPNPVSVDFDDANGTAGAGFSCNGGFTPVDGTLNFAPGETTKVVRIQLLDCLISQNFSSFSFRLLPATQENGDVTRPSTLVGIVDDDKIVATPRLLVRDLVVDEADATAYVSVLLGGPHGQASNSTVTVEFTTSNGTAAAGSDYTATSGALTFAPGETAKTVPVAITNDATVEGVESFTLELSGETQSTIADRRGVVTIGRSDGAMSAQPDISVSPDLVVGEGDGYVDVTVGLSAPSSNAVEVDFDDVNATAGAGFSCNGAFTPVDGRLHFAPAETTKVVRIQLLDCLNAQGFSSFFFRTLNPDKGAIARATSRVGLIDNDSIVATPKLIVRDATVDEKDGFALVSVHLGWPPGESSNSTVTVDYSSANGSAISGSDFTEVTGTLTFAPGESTKTIVVPIADDGATEGPESFRLELDNQNLATILDGTGTVTIGASDAAAIASPSIFSTPDAAVSEAAGFVDVTVTLGSPGLNPVSVNYATSNGTAGAGFSCNGDYTPTTGALRFAPGETTKVVRVEIVNCAAVEAAETFNFTLSGQAGGTIADATGVTTICDDDGPVGLCTIALTPASPTIQVGANQQFTATGTNSDMSTVDLTGSATWGSSSTGVATISAGGLAHGETAGSSTISAVQGGITGSTVLTVTSSQLAQTITFAALANKTYGDPDFAVSASASSGLAVSFAASGNCTVAGATVHITGAGSCTITASQAGNGGYLPATPVARSFTIGKAAQTISFGALANKKVGDPDFGVIASASSGLAVSFAASGNCTIAGATVHITGAGSCTITASQAGNANYNAAASVARSFTITRPAAPPPPVVKCKVPSVVAKKLAKARSLITKAHCRVGKVTRTYSRKRKKDVVIGQSKRPGRVVAKNTKIDLVVSRGRRR